MNTMKNELEFLHVAEQLKQELRHSWLSSGRRESVAEHSWRLSLMVLQFAHKLDQAVNIEKCLKLAIVHDLPEAKAGDIPVFDVVDHNAKYQNELNGLKEMCALLSGTSQNEIFNLWLEFEEQKTYESKFIKALDKLEVFIQHNEASLDTWEEHEKHMLFQDKWLRKHCKFDSCLAALCEAVIADGIAKLKQAGDNVAAIQQQAQELAIELC